MADAKRTSPADSDAGPEFNRHIKKPSEADEKMPNAGPHARPELTNKDATPGAGTLPPVGKSDDGNESPTG
jgi:hypothetical protein